MFEEGQKVQIHGVKEEVKEKLSKALKTPFDQIKFYFVEHEENDNVVLSAESSTKFAIIHVPLESIIFVDPNAIQEVEDLVRYMLIDHALKDRNEEWFYELTNPQPEEEDILIGQVFDEGEDS